MIKTARLVLEPCTLEHLNALIEGTETFENTYHLKVMEGYLEFPEALGFMLKSMPESGVYQWGSYLYIQPTDKVLLGLGGFKGAPNDEGMVEIGYGVAHAYRGQGYATEAAQGLIDFAFSEPSVQKVWAHTLADDNASTHVLQKCGLVRIDEFDDPDDGRLWRWEILRPA